MPAGERSRHGFQESRAVGWSFDGRGHHCRHGQEHVHRRRRRAGICRSCRPDRPASAGRQEKPSRRHHHRRDHAWLPAVAQGDAAKRLLHTGLARRRSRQAARNRRPLSGHRRPAAHPRRPRRPAGPRLPCRCLGPWDARRHGSRQHGQQRRRVRLPGRPGRHGAHPGSFRRRPRAQGVGNHRPQRARARHRSAHRQQGRGRQDRGQDLLQRHSGGHSADRREDRRCAERRNAVALCRTLPTCFASARR